MSVTNRYFSKHGNYNNRKTYSMIAGPYSHENTAKTIVN
jgi:hypothetical protein